MKVLVAYETAYGSTEETAEAVADVLRERGARVDVIRCREVKSVEGYDAFVIGAPLHTMTWLKPAQQFVREHEDALASHPTAYFYASHTGGVETRRAGLEKSMRGKLHAYAPSVEPLAIGDFGGVMDFDKYPLPTRLLMQAIAKAQGGPTSGRVDQRHWERIRAWAAEVYDRLATPAASV